MKFTEYSNLANIQIRDLKRGYYYKRIIIGPDKDHILYEYKLEVSPGLVVAIIDEADPGRRFSLSEKSNPVTIRESRLTLSLVQGGILGVIIPNNMNLYVSDDIEDDWVNAVDITNEGDKFRVE